MDRRWLGLAAAFAVLGDALAVSLALPEIQRDVDAGFSELQWLLASFAVSCAVFLALGGPLARLLGARPAFGLGAALYTAAAAVCGLTDDAGVLHVARGVQGAGAGLLLGAVAGSASGSLAAAAFAAGPLLGGVLTEVIGWEAVFFAMAAAGLAVLVLGRPEEAPSAELPAASVLLRNPSFLGAALGAFVLWASVISLLPLLSIYLQRYDDNGPVAAALALLALALPALALAPVSQRLAARFGERWPMGAGLALAGTGILLMRALGPGDDWTALLPGFVLTGAGVGLAAPAVRSTTVGVVDQAVQRAAGTFVMVCRQAGLAVGVLVLGMLFTDSIKSEVKGNFLTIFGAAGDFDDFIATGAVAFSGSDAIQRFGDIFYVLAFDDILIAAGFTAIFAALACFILVRPEDFVARKSEASAAGSR